MSKIIDGSDWGELVDRLGSFEALADSAKSSGALLRRRGIIHAADLLRLCFAYVLGGWSLRTLAAWAQERGLASLSDVALLNRLRGSADWVGALVSQRLAERCPQAVAGLGGALRWVAVDATVVAPPGPKRDYWVVHTAFDLSTLTLRAVEITDQSQAERLSRNNPRPGELRIADRAHAKVNDLAQVIKAGAEFLVRAPCNSPRLLNQDGERINRLELCLKAQADGFADQIVKLQDGKSKREVAARVVILPLPPEAAEKARQSARRLALKAQYKVSDDAIEMAGYLVLLTSLAKDDWPPERLAAAYRLRWQVELAFKRMKSLIGLERLRAKDPDLARLWINTALLCALLAEDDMPALDPEAPDSLPMAAPMAV